MKVKRLIMLTFVLSLLCTMTAFADSSTYESYAKAKVSVNDNVVPEGDVPAFVINGSTVLPLRQTVDSLQGLVHWDNATRTASIYKPNVSMIFSEDVSGKDYTIKKPFSRVDTGKNLSFVIFVQVDNLKTNVNGFKISIEDPDGVEVDDPLEVKQDILDDSFWYTYPTKVRFSQSGNYTVKFSFLYEGEYRVVAEKQIRSE